MDETKETFYDIYLKWAKNWTSRPKEKRKTILKKHLLEDHKRWKDGKPKSKVQSNKIL